MRVGYWHEELKTARWDVLLLGLSFGTAIVDAYTFLELQIFVANMTGNSVFLGLGAAGIVAPEIHPVRSIIALLMFWLGSYTSGRLASLFGPKTRFYLFGSWLIQSLLVLLASLLLFQEVVGYEYFALILPLALAFGLQASSCRPLAVPAITTVVVTSAMVDMFCDPKLFERKNLGRNQRAVFIVTMFLGSVVGGLLLNNLRQGGAFALLLAAIIKFFVALVLLLIPGSNETKMIAVPPVLESSQVVGEAVGESEEEIRASLPSSEEDGRKIEIRN